MNPKIMNLPLLFRTILSVAFCSLALATASGQPTAPEDQVESDWVDNRWNSMEVGPFLASNLKISNRHILKALSIKVGQQDQGAVCFDTQQGVLRGGWIGGFLQMDPARYGLIRAPRIVGDPVFSVPRSPNHPANAYHYTGMHLQGERVVLEYRIHGVRILESPWLMERSGLTVITRTFEIEQSRSKVNLVVANGDNLIKSINGRNGSGLVFEHAKDCLAVAAISPDIRLLYENGQVILTIPAREKTRRFKLLYWSGERARLSQFKKAADSIQEIEDLESLMEPGPPRWQPELTTTGRRGLNQEILAVDTLTVPYENPWNALMFLSGVDFMPNGDAYVCTIHGDVWRVNGIDEDLQELQWKRFATGLFQPLGLQVRDGRIFVLGRDQITRLHDLNDDGEADFYENFCSLIETQTGHNYVAALETDEAGNFYFVDSTGAHRVSPDGNHLQTLATGFRNPNGLGVRPDGEVITVAPQQGTWTPSSMICEIEPGGYYGFGGPRVTHDRPLGYDPPLCWIPHRVDNSSGSQVWIPDNQWGPLSGHMLHLLWGRCGMALVLRDVVKGTAQGAVVPLPVRFLSGPHRGTFNPNDGHLYIAGSRGWQTSAVRDGALQRVRYTGQPVLLPVDWHAHANGLSLTFAQPLDPETSQDTGSYAVQQWNYRYTSDYGSQDWSVADPDKAGRDDLLIESAHLLPDGKSVFLEIPDLKPVMQMRIRYNIDTASGQRCRGRIWLTLNRLNQEKSSISRPSH